MKYLRKFENLDSDLGISRLHYAKAHIGLSIGVGDDIKDVSKISKMIEDYKIMYIRNQEWGGGPTNREWLQKYHKDFNVEIQRAAKAYKPCIILNIEVEGFGILKLGFSIRDKSCVIFNYGEMGNKIDCDRCEGSGWAIPGYRSCRKCGGDGKMINPEYEEANNDLHNYSKQLFKDKLSFDDVIVKLQLQLNDEDFDFVPIEK